jgi:transposase-like protein
MVEGRRARTDEYARRINASAELLEAGIDVAEAVRRVARQHGISERQARRYVERAQVGGVVPVPSPTRAFTIKLPSELLQRLRAYARRSQQTLSVLVAQAVEEFLARARVGPRRGR